MPDKKLCESCKTNLAAKHHLCPLWVELDDNEKDTCTCCQSCQDECAGSI